MVDTKIIDQFENSFGEIYSNNNLILWQDYKGFINIYREDGDFVVQKKGYYNYQTFKNDNMYYFDANDNILKILKSDNEDIKIESINSNGYIWDKLFIKTNGRNLSCKNIISGSLFWQYTLPESHSYTDRFGILIEGKISKIIAIYKDILWTVVNTGDIIGFDVKDGHIKYELPSKIEDRKAYYDYATKTQLDEERGILFGLWHTYFWEIDTKNPLESYVLYDLRDEFDKWYIKAEMTVSEWSWKGDEIYFGEIYDADRKNNTNTIGVFNRQKKEILWAERVGNKGETLPIIQKVDFRNDRLYVLDGERVLHIFSIGSNDPLC